MMANMIPQTHALLSLTLVFSMAMGVAVGIVPEASQDTRELTTFGRNFWSTADPQHYRISEDGEVGEVVLDQLAAAGFASKMRYLFGRFTIQMKVHRGDSAGTVSTFYTSSLSGKHDELDFEFLGNENGKPYVLQTNVYASGEGDREQRVRLWFDPTEDFHTYGVHWNKEIVIFFVDDTPIRIYKNCEDLGVPFPNRQAQSVFASLWNGEDWATQNGAIKLNWTHAPFIASYKNFEAEGCEVPWYKGDVEKCNSTDIDALLDRATFHQLTTRQIARLQWVTENLMMYDYCKDFNRYPQGHPECSRNSGLQLIGPLPLKHLDGLKIVGQVKKGYYSDI